MNKKIQKTILLTEMIILIVLMSLIAGLMLVDGHLLSVPHSQSQISEPKNSSGFLWKDDSQSEKIIAVGTREQKNIELDIEEITFDCGPFQDWIPYIIEDGDSLEGLLHTYQVSLKDFQKANCLGNSEVIVAGQTVFLPELTPETGQSVEVEKDLVSEELTSQEPNGDEVLGSGEDSAIEEKTTVGELKPDADNWVLIQPGRNTGYIKNPGIGWQYFFSSDRTNTIPQSVTYGDRTELYWSILNPGDGVYDWSVLDAQLNTAVARGEQFSFRIYTSADTHRIPQWVLDSGVALLPNGDIDHLSCVYQEQWGRFVNALAARYDGNPNIAYIDISGYGDFNEWSWESKTEWDYLWADAYEAGTANASTMSTMDSYARRRLADIFIGGSYSGHQCKNPNGTIRALDYAYPGFQETQLVMPYAGIRQSTQYVFTQRKDVGFRYDCLGRESGNDILTRLGDEIKGIWPNAPVVMEPCVSSSFDYGTALYQSGELHTSLFHNANIDFTDEQIINLAGNAGYRYRLLSAGFDGMVVAGGDLNVQLAFRNVGSAPSYPKMGQIFSLHIFIADQDGNVIEDYLLPADISTWGPSLGTKTLAKGSGFIDNLTIPEDIPPGTYKVLVGIVNDRTDLPINLDVDLRPINGLYPLGDLVVTTP